MTTSATANEPGPEQHDGITRRTVLRGAAIVAAAGAVGVSLNACASSESSSPGGAKPKRGGTLQLALADTQASETLDPATLDFATEYVLTGALYNTLIKERVTDWSLRPHLAESWESNSDFTRYQIKLRKGVAFHNGKPLDAEDVVWSIQRHFDPKVGSTVAPRLKMSMAPDSVKAAGPDTVIIDLNRPDSQLPHLLANAKLSIVAANQDKFTVETVNGTGPFKLDSWRAATNWSISRNDQYWETGLPYLDGVNMSVNQNSASRFQGVLTGQFGLAEEIDYSSAAKFLDSSDIKVLRFTRGTSRTLVMDGTVKPFNDPRVRLAFKYATDRKEILSAVYSGFAEPTSDLFIPPDDPYYPSDLGVRPYDPARAKSLLREAGYPDGLSVTLHTSTAVTSMVQLAETFSQSAEAAGIRVKIVQSDAPTYWDQVWLQKPFYTSYWQTFYPPDAFWYADAPDAPYNESKLKDRRVTRTLDQIMRTDDQAKQIRLSQDMFAIIAEEFGHIVPANIQSPWVSSPKVHGVEGDQPHFRALLTRAYMES